jgi:hypothetical protein
LTFEVVGWIDLKGAQQIARQQLQFVPVCMIISKRMEEDIIDSRKAVSILSLVKKMEITSVEYLLPNDEVRLFL